MTQSAEALAIRLIEDERIDDAVLAPLFEFDETSLPSPSAAGRPRAAEGIPRDSGVPSWAYDVPNRSTAAEGTLGAFNRRWQRLRHERYARRAPGFKGVRVVSEGDSWFQYPALLHDVVDHLFDRDDFNIYCQAFAGDWLSNIVCHHEYYAAIEFYEPHVFMLSGGGNDVLGKGNLSRILEPYSRGREPSDYLGPRFDRTLDDLRRLYEFVFHEVTSNFPKLLVVSHGYDYGVPDHGKWLGSPMEDIGIDDPDLQQKIVRAIIDRYGDMKIELSSKFDRVHHVETRGVVHNWYDELHPEDDGFGDVAAQFAAVIAANL